MKKILFLNLKTFSSTGGIEKVNRAFLKALSDLDDEGTLEAHSCSAYDLKSDTRYFQQHKYNGFKGNKVRFALYVLLSSPRYDTIILSHIHLAPVAWIIKALSPSKQIILVAHGIEVWRKLSWVQMKILQNVDEILAVSAFTKQKLVEKGADPGKIRVFHNTIDPYFNYPVDFNKQQYLLDRYGLEHGDAVVFTLTRLSSTEKDKGYDGIIRAIPKLKKRYPRIKYLLAGRYDESEKKRLDSLIDLYNVSGNVILPGFIKDEEITDHYLLADLFILPSRKEGFGIVFIEAMACGLPVIAGNQDGSQDALKNSELGMLVDPENEAEILSALEQTLRDHPKNKSKAKELQQKVHEAFGFERYKQNLKEVFTSSARPSAEGRKELIRLGHPCTQRSDKDLLNKW